MNPPLFMVMAHGLLSALLSPSLILFQSKHSHYVFSLNLVLQFKFVSLVHTVIKIVCYAD